MKGRPLLPTLRTKKRYVVYEAISSSQLSHDEVVNAIKGSFRDCFGIFGLGKAGLMDTRLYKKNRGIIKINNNCIDNLKTSMAMVTDIKERQLILTTAYVSGILNKAKLNLG